MKNLVLAVLIAVPSVSSAQESITVVGFNVESGGADPLVVAELVAEMNEIDIWGFSEVQNAEWADAFEEAAESDEAADYVQVLGTTGGGDKLLIVYDADRFDKIDDFELHDMREGGGRSPLVVQLAILQNPPCETVLRGTERH